jgi:hypothetical protein
LFLAAKFGRLRRFRIIGGFAAAGKVPSRKLQRAYVLFIIILDLMVVTLTATGNFATLRPLTFLALDLYATGHSMNFPICFANAIFIYAPADRQWFLFRSIALQRPFDVPTGLAD